jgi:hypothetical protein
MVWLELVVESRHAAVAGHASASVRIASLLGSYTRYGPHMLVAMLVDQVVRRAL